MAESQGTGTFQVSGDAYDAFMGRYSRQLANAFADYCGLAPGRRFLDVGCGPGALTGVAVSRVGTDAVAAVDPSDGFVQECRQRYPGVDVRCAPAEGIPFEDDEFDVAAAQLVFHFVSDPDRAVAQMSRVVRPSGTVAGAVWDLADRMELLRAFWDAALTVDPAAPDEARILKFGRGNELAALFSAAGLSDVEESMITVESEYTDFEELWGTLLGGIGPAGAYLVSRSAAEQERLRTALHERLGQPSAAFRLSATARAVRGVVPE